MVRWVTALRLAKVSTLSKLMYALQSGVLSEDVDTASVMMQFVNGGLCEKLRQGMRRRDDLVNTCNCVYVCVCVCGVVVR